MVVIDGNEKLYRYCCAEPIERVEGIAGNANRVIRCINNPSRGNQNLVGSTKCNLHRNNEKAKGLLIERLDLYPNTRQKAKQLEMKITSGEGCKEESNCNKFEKRTAGMIYMFRSCGIRLSHYEMHTAESLSMVFTALLDMFSEKSSEYISGVVYDRACDLYPYIKRLSKEGNVFATILEKLRYIVDIFHAEKHSQSKCVLGSSDCKYHPDLDKFSDVRKMNMEICEQSFHILNCYKHITRNMTYAKRLIFLKLIDDDFNRRLEKKLKL